MKNWTIAFFSILYGLSAHAQTFEADVDRSELTQDESVQLRMNIAVDGNQAVSEPQFDAPDFELLNQFRSTYIESFYQNGKFGMKNNQKFTFVLRPMKTGTLTIKNLKVNANGHTLSAPSITVTVGQSGAGSPPPSGYRSGLGLRGAGSKTRGREFFLKADVNKARVVKGEQVIVSYWLYRRARVFNLQVEKYPTMSGFLREELEMPVLSPRLETESVVVEGIPYERSLLVRYAAYPIKDGKLEVDPMGAKLSYQGRGNPQGLGLGDDEDPFQNFFSQFGGMGQTLTGNVKSEPISIEVVPLPDAGRPETFNGGVGNFTITASTTANSIPAGEAFSVNVKIEGRGNLSSLESYSVKWPDGIRQYDVQNKSQSNKSAVSTRNFEFILIAEKEGALTLPPMPFSFYDPERKEYRTVQTEPLSLQVTAAKNPQALTGGQNEDFRAEKNPSKSDSSAVSEADLQKWSHLLWKFLAVVAVFGALIFLKKPLSNLKQRINERKRRQAEAQSAAAARLQNEVASALKNPTADHLNRAYETLSQFLLEELEQRFNVPAKSLARTELRRRLRETPQVTDDLWSKIDRILEYSEQVKYGAAAGIVSLDDARNQLQNWVEAAQGVRNTLNRKS